MGIPLEVENFLSLEKFLSIEHFSFGSDDFLSMENFFIDREFVKTIQNFIIDREYIYFFFYWSQYWSTVSFGAITQQTRYKGK